MATDIEIERLAIEKARVDLDRIRVANDEQKFKLETAKLELERFNADRVAEKPHLDGLYRFAEIAIRSLLLLNGGSALALLMLQRGISQRTIH